MNRQEIVRKVAEKLQLDEATVDAVYMHQTQAVSESLKHPDRNVIFLPGIGSLNFKVSKAADKLHTYLRRIERYNKKMDEVDNPRTVTSLANRVHQMSELAEVLKWKVSLVSPKYNGIRMEAINKSLTYYSGGKFVELVDNLRKQRENGFGKLNKENIPKQKKALEKQAGDSPGVRTLPVLSDSPGGKDDGREDNKMQRKFMRTIRSVGEV